MAEDEHARALIAVVRLQSLVRPQSLPHCGTALVTGCISLVRDLYSSLAGIICSLRMQMRPTGARVCIHVTTRTWWWQVAAYAAKLQRAVADAKIVNKLQPPLAGAAACTWYY